MKTDRDWKCWVVVAAAVACAVGCGNAAGGRTATAGPGASSLPPGPSVRPSSTPGRPPVTGRIRVALAHGCPPRVTAYSGVDNPDPLLGRRMVPPGRPSAGLVCFYPPLTSAPAAGGSMAAGPSESPGTPAPRSLALPARAAARLARALDAVRTGPPGGKEISACPDDRGVTDIIVLAYPGRPDTDIWYHASGCQSFSNGKLSAYEIGNAAFYWEFLPAFAAITAAAGG
jgi:hypothetical protein